MSCLGRSMQQRWPVGDSAMVLAIFWIPLFYVVVCSIFEKKRPEPANEKEKEALQ